ncbi:hypothetical protein TNIN_364311 [Trichonephila inaurata madagascariensis]|uniref:Uncharacterized protein n=1 Tax=Trichonephila inaurata madagascariensis TaxID=2747483 RepID=A0A8X7CMZ5_9ARAC|nr:hypothetical protein TNIN_364311 [Trichonephila inaurata madagascariensis]
MTISSIKTYYKTLLYQLRFLRRGLTSYNPPITTSPSPPPTSPTEQKSKVAQPPFSQADRSHHMIPRRIHPVIHSFRAFNNWRLDDNCLRARARAWPQFSGPPQPFDARDKNLFCATTTFHCRRQHPSPNWTCDCPVTTARDGICSIKNSSSLPFLFGKRFYLPFLLPLYSPDGGSWRSKVCQMAKVVLDYPPKISSLSVLVQSFLYMLTKGVFFFFHVKECF